MAEPKWLPSVRLAPMEASPVPITLELGQWSDKEELSLRWVRLKLTPDTDLRDRWINVWVTKRSHRNINLGPVKKKTLLREPLS